MQQNLLRYFVNPDEAYSSILPFQETVDFLNKLAEEKQFYKDLSIKESVLVIELKSGVFIRAANTGWCNLLTGFAELEVEKKVFSIIGTQRWLELTRDIKQPISSYGDAKLVRWKIGF